MIDYVHQACLQWAEQYKQGTADFTLTHAVERMAETPCMQKPYKVFRCRYFGSGSVKARMRDSGETHIEFWNALQSAHSYLAASIPFNAEPQTVYTTNTISLDNSAAS